MTTAKHMKTLMATVLYILAVLVSNCAFGLGGGRGDTVEAWETVKGNFKVRVIEYKEKNPVHLTHFFYVFESAAASQEWQEIMEVKNDDDVPLPREQIRFVNDRIAYLFMNEKYAVSIDGGGAWKVWEATPKNLPELQHDPGYIKSAHIELDGRGRLVLDALLDGQINSLTLYTQDYGQHWTAK